MKLRRCNFLNILNLFGTVKILLIYNCFLDSIIKDFEDLISMTRVKFLPNQESFPAVLPDFRVGISQTRLEEGFDLIQIFI